MSESRNYYQQIKLFFRDKQRVKILGRLISGFMLIAFIFLYFFAIFSSVITTSIIWFNNFLLIGLVWLNIAISYYFYLLFVQKYLIRSKSLFNILRQYVKGVLIGAIIISYTLILQIVLFFLGFDKLTNFWLDFVFISGILIYFGRKKLKNVI